MIETMKNEIEIEANILGAKIVMNPTHITWCVLVRLAISNNFLFFNYVTRNACWVTKVCSC